MIRLERFRTVAVAALFVVSASAGASAADQAAVTTVSNPYGLDALWAQGDFVARGTLGILATMSLASWFILITKLIDQWVILRRAKSADSDFWSAPSLEVGVRALAADSPFRFLAVNAIADRDRHAGSLGAHIDLHNWVSLSIQRGYDQINARLQSGLSVLATVGSTAPFVGLFGTVWGIYHALTAIGIAGQASIDKVAGPVGESLIMTAVGLGVAVPAVLGYNWLLRRNKTANDHVRQFGANLHAVLLGAPSVRAGQSAQHPVSVAPGALGQAVKAA